MILHLILALGLVQETAAIVPDCSVLLLCNQTAFTDIWLQAALTEALWNYQLLFGAFLLDGTFVDGCFEDIGGLDTTLTAATSPRFQNSTIPTRRNRARVQARQKRQNNTRNHQ
jgi:hypothetical protein